MSAIPLLAGISCEIMSSEDQSNEKPPSEEITTHTTYTSFEHKYNRPRAQVKWLLLDVFCFVVVSLPILLFFYLGVPYNRGFNCHDDSINKPFKHSTVSSTVATAVGLILPAIMFVLVEYLRHRSKSLKVASGKDLGPVIYLGPIKLNPLLLKLLKIIVVFLFGAAVNVLLTDIGKYGVGRLRPHFLDVCKPKLEISNCTEGEYITGDVCTGDPSLIRQARLSFPSGHSSFAAYTMVFLILYLQARLSISSSIFLKPVLQIVALILALLCGISRISDYKHHWSDVLAGFILGTLVAYVMVWKLLKWFKKIPGENQKMHLKDIV